MSEEGPEFKEGEQRDTYSVEPRKPEMRTPQEMDEVLANLEKGRRSLPFADWEGNVLGEFDYNSLTGDVLEIKTQFHGLSLAAESPSEYIYATNAKGEILPERMTRGEARTSGQRYLIVTTLIFHDRKMLFQARSPEKSIDPGKLSSSSNGVAKELCLEGKRIESTNLSALLNAALEINEELRYGQDIKPFTIRIWPGRLRELTDWAASHQIDDHDSIYLIPEILLGAEGYPLLDELDEKSARTRALLSGLVLSKREPQIVFDPKEVASIEWSRTSKMKDNPNVTRDAQVCIDAIFDLWSAQNQDPEISARMAKETLRNFLRGQR